MKAICVDSSAPLGLRMADVADPVPGPNQILVRVQVFSVIERNLRHARTLAPYTIPGFDAAGVVVQSAVDGSGPGNGARVATLDVLQCGWAELRAVNLDEVAIVPDGVDLGAATSMVVPAVTALRALRRFGSLLGRRILITGASGAVGWYAIQLGCLAGAYVIAGVRDPVKARQLEDLGASETVVGLDQIVSPVYGVIDNVGGPQLVQAFTMLEEGGSVLSLGWMSGEPAVFAPYQTVGARRRIEGFWMGGSVGKDLEFLLNLAGRGKLKPREGWHGDWKQLTEVAEALANRRISTSAILSV